jgi:polyhydroxyalkanoate synthesis regulator phasin
MLELLKKGFYTGLGLALITKEKAEELAKEAEQEFEKKAETLVNNAIKKIDVPSKKEFIAITRRLAKLEGKIEELKKKIAE